MMWQGNVKSKFLCAQEAAKAMIRQGSGDRIIDISSGSAINAVSPGFTDRADGPNPYAPPAYRQSMLSHIPQGRAGVLREIAQSSSFWLRLGSANTSSAR